MGTYNDDRNWDQQELDRARQLAKDNVVTEGSTVPNAARLNADRVPETEKPNPVLEGERFTTEKEREEVEAREDTTETVDTARKTFDEDTKDVQTSSK